MQDDFDDKKSIVCLLMMKQNFWVMSYLIIQLQCMRLLRITISLVNSISEGDEAIVILDQSSFLW